MYPGLRDMTTQYTICIGFGFYGMGTTFTGKPIKEDKINNIFYL